MDLIPTMNLRINSNKTNICTFQRIYHFSDTHKSDITFIHKVVYAFIQQFSSEKYGFTWRAYPNTI